MNKNIDKVAVMATVETFMNKGFMFSAFDVTKTIRANVGKNVFIPHTEVREVVSSMYEDGSMGQYVRDLAKMGSSSEAWVYYHPVSDINDYDSDWINSNPNQDGMKADKDSSNSSTSMPPLTLDVDVGGNTLKVHNKDSIVNPSSPIQKAITAIKNFKSPFAKAIDSCSGQISSDPNINASKYKYHKLTKEGRLNIPKSILDKVIANSNKMLYIKRNQSNLCITTDPSISYDYCKYIADRTGRMRLSLSDIDPITSGNPYASQYKISCDGDKGIVIEVVK